MIDRSHALRGNAAWDALRLQEPNAERPLRHSHAERGNDQLLLGENGTSASLDDYLHFTVTGNGASVIASINVSATAGATPNQTIDLAGIDLASHYGVTPGAGGMIAGGADTAKNRITQTKPRAPKSKPRRSASRRTLPVSWPPTKNSSCPASWTWAMTWTTRNCDRAWLPGAQVGEPSSSSRVSG